MNLKDFLPPILIRTSKRFMHNQGREHVQEFYNSYEDALAACLGGYENDDLVNVVYKKTRIYRDALLKQSPFVADGNAFRTLMGISLSLRGDQLNVIDFGGGCGAHYFLAKLIFGTRIKFRWHVVETSQMASKALDLEDGQLQFYDDVSNANRAFEHVDLIFSSGALQYVPRPSECLEKLVECRSSHIYITRVGLSNLEKELIFVQRSRLSDNGPGPLPKGMQDGSAQYPVTIARKERFEEILNRYYTINIIFEEDQAAYKIQGNSVAMYGYFASLKNG